MRYAEESYARKLYKDLQKRFGYKATLASTLRKIFGGTLTAGDTLLSIEGAGVHWNCAVERGERLCTVTCFSADHGAEYRIAFEVAESAVAYGRSFDKTQVIDAVEDWLNYLSLEQMYERHSFVDERKRALEIIRATLFSQHPLLKDQCRHWMEQESPEFPDLYIENGVRSCKTGASWKCAYSEFRWDGTKIFNVSGLDPDRFGHLVKKWVCDAAMPSALQQEFPEIGLDGLAAYYEQGNGIGGEFILSWDRLEEFYEKETNLEKKAEILQLIRTMRAKGFDKTFRAGTSLFSFILSRSRRYGLRHDQPWIRFDFVYIKSAMTVDHYGRNSEQQHFSFDTVEYNEAVEQLLKELEKAEIS